MKYSIVFPAFLMVCSIQAQNRAVIDTASYLVHEIVDEKSQYIGKPFSVLLDSLKIAPVQLGIDWGPPADSLKGRSAFLDFNYSTQFKQRHYLIIDWQNPLPWDVFAPVMRTTFQALKNLYTPIIIKDISIKDYSRNHLDHN